MNIVVPDVEFHAKRQVISSQIVETMDLTARVRPLEECQAPSEHITAVEATRGIRIPPP